MNARTRRIAVVIAALAVAVTPAAFSKPAAAPVTTGPTPATPPPTLPRPSGYSFNGDVSFELHQKWTKALGSERQRCGRWYRGRGESYVFILGDVLGQFSPSAIPHSLQWALFTGHGKIDDRIATTTSGNRINLSGSARTLQEDGGVNWTASCGPGRPEPYPIERHPDCETAQDIDHERTVHGTFQIAATRLKSTVTLDDIQDAPFSGKPAILFVGTPQQRGWYRRCHVSQLGLELPVLAFPADSGDVRALSRLRVGRDYHYRHEYPWTQCAAADATPEGETCRFKGYLKITFHHLTAQEAARIR